MKNLFTLTNSLKKIITCDLFVTKYSLNSIHYTTHTFYFFIMHWWNFIKETSGNSDSRMHTCINTIWHNFYSVYLKKCKKMYLNLCTKISKLRPLLFFSAKFFFEKFEPQLSSVSQSLLVLLCLLQKMSAHVQQSMKDFFVVSWQEIFTDLWSLVCLTISDTMFVTKLQQMPKDGH